jgi:hypothetical protein
MHPLRLALSTLSLIVLAAQPSSAEEWQKTYPITGRPELVLRTDDGQVSVDTWDRHEIGVRITTRGLRIGGRGLRITDDATDHRVEIEAREPSHLFSFRVGFDRRWTRIEVMVPKTSDLDIVTGDGPVVIRPSHGSLRVRTGDGSIAVEGAKGTLSLHTGDGSIRASDLEGTLVAGSGDGSLQISGRFSALDLETGDGRITANAEPLESRDAWRIVSGDGSVVLSLPEGFKADLDAQTGDGHISLDFPVEVSGTFRHTLIRGTLNGGGAPLRVKTGDGSIRIRRL